MASRDNRINREGEAPVPGDSLAQALLAGLRAPGALIGRGREAPERIRGFLELSDAVAEVSAAADGFMVSPVESIPYSLYKLFDTTGDRIRYEASYFSHRRRLVALGIASWLFDRTDYLEALEDALWAVCDEYSWALPAHMGCRSLHPDCLETNALELDLFSTETAFALAEICYLLEERLSPAVVQRARSEVFRRVLSPFERSPHPFGWETSCSNWCAVCAGSLGAASLYLIDEPERLSTILARLVADLDHFIASFSRDGVCLEGLGYWNYGVGFYVAFADLLASRTGVDLLAGDRFAGIARFQSLAYLNSRLSVSFADGSPHERYRRGLASWLCTHIPGAAMPPPALAAPLSADECGRWALSFRDFLWAPYASGDSGDSGALPASAPSRSCYFPAAQWLIIRENEGTAEGGRLAFAAKGGDNGEPHNHNDMGSFMLARGGEVFLADLGCGEYVKDYFNERRYTIFCNSSLGHSVPIICGQAQCPGKEFRAERVEYSDQNGRVRLSMELRGAYAVDSLRSFVRTFEYEWGRSRLVIVDEFDFGEGEGDVVERFVSPRSPVPQAGDLRWVFPGSAAKLLLLAAPGTETRCQSSVSLHEHREHDGSVSTVSSLDFNCARQGFLRIRFEFELLD